MDDLCQLDIFSTSHPPTSDDLDVLYFASGPLKDYEHIRATAQGYCIVS